MRTRRAGVAAFLCALLALTAMSERAGVVRFGMSADAHIKGRIVPANEERLLKFVEAMIEWKPDFVIDLGDFACQVGGGQTTPELHDAQLNGLKHHWATLSNVPCPAYLVIGNHDVGWIKGGDETIKPEDLYRSPHSGEDITKDELLAVTGLPHRYYSFDVKGCHFIVLDGNNQRDGSAPEPGHDGVVGGYFIDGPQKEWLAKDLAANRDKIKIVFCHEELHHTSPEGSGEGGDVPFPPVGKDRSYVDNGWELREMFEADGNVVACFHGHKHRNRWTIYGGVNYITLAALHWSGPYAKVTLSDDQLHIEGCGQIVGKEDRRQRSYTIPLPERTKE